MGVEFSSRVKARISDMGRTDQAIARFFLEHQQRASGMTSAELAREIRVSKSAITRFVQHMGYSSLREMRVHLASSSSLPVFFDDFEKGSTLGTARSVFEQSANSLIETMSVLDEEVLERAVGVLGHADVCGLFGMGGSQPILLSALHRFQRTSLRMIHHPDLHMQLEMAANLASGDCALIVSHSGRNRDVLRISQILMERKVPVILITSNPISPLAERADAVLCSIADETRRRPEAITSAVAQMVLIDTLFMLYASRVDKEPERFTRIREVIDATRL